MQQGNEQQSYILRDQPCKTDVDSLFENRCSAWWGVNLLSRSLLAKSLSKLCTMHAHRQVNATQWGDDAPEDLQEGVRQLQQQTQRHSNCHHQWRRFNINGNVSRGLLNCRAVSRDPTRSD